MDFSKTHFGRSLDDLRLNDIVNYFRIERVESDATEFKSFGGKVEDQYVALCRTICGFLNSNGGLIVWGAPQGVKIPGKRELSFKGPLSLINETLGKDQLISKISDSIIPLPASIRTKIITNTSNQSVCIIEVDPSESAPHQTRNTYYMRIDGQTKPAPHHYVEALFKKIRFPNLEGFVRFNNVQINHGHGNLQINLNAFFFNWSPLQNVENLSFRMTIFPGEFIPGNSGDKRRQNVHSVLHFGEPYSESHTLLVNRQVLKQNKDELHLAMNFGARNTPSKVSEYWLDLSSPNAKVDLELSVSLRKENLLFKDVQDSKGITRENTLAKILGKNSKKFS